MLINRIPKKWFTSTRYEIEQATTLDTLLLIMAQIKEAMGIDYYSMETFFDCLDRDKDIVFISADTPMEWQQKYQQEGLVRYDARIIKARKSFLPFLWKEIEAEGHGDLSILKAAAQYQVNYGISFPVHGPNNSFGFLHFIYKTEPSKMNSRFEHITPYIQIIAMQLIESLRRIVKLYPIYANFNCADGIKLTKRQRQCLIWAGEGKTSEEIAIILNLSCSMVTRHLDNAAEALYAENRTQSVVKAVDQKLIALQHKKKPCVFYLN